MREDASPRLCFLHTAKDRLRVGVLRELAFRGAGRIPATIMGCVRGIESSCRKTHLFLANRLVCPTKGTFILKEGLCGCVIDQRF